MSKKFSSFSKILRHQNASRINRSPKSVVLEGANKNVSKARQFSSLSSYIPQTNLVATVFGSSGFLARYVVSRLCKISSFSSSNFFLSNFFLFEKKMNILWNKVKLGAQVVVAYRGQEKDINHLKPMSEVGQLVPLPFSLREYSTIENAVSKSDLVVNLGSTKKTYKQNHM